MNEFLKYLYNPTTISLVIGGLLTSFFGFLAGISKAQETPKWISWGSFIAGIIVLGAGIFTGYQNQLSDQLIQSKTSEIAEISKKNVELALKNSELNERIANSITGGDSYCYVLLSPSNENYADLILVKEGEDPLYNVKVRIHDIEKRIENFNKALQKGLRSDLSISDHYNLINRSAIFIEIGDIGHNQGFTLGKLPLPEDKDKARFEIEIKALNGRVLQLVQYRRVKGKWIWAEKIHFRNKVVRKYIDPEFPKDEESKTFWEE